MTEIEKNALGRSTRLRSVDALLGLMLMLLALDFSRDFISVADYLPTDLSRTNFIFFMTRWITYLYAPMIILISGLYIYIRKIDGFDNKSLSKFLLVRALVLLILEVTIVSFLWTFNLEFPLYLHLIWVLGVSMLLMAILVHLPVATSLITALILIGGHNLFAHVSSLEEIHVSFLEMLLHGYGLGEFLGKTVFVLYPAIPWIGVAALGYGLGAVYEKDVETRAQILMRVGALITVAFIILRFMNHYGDPKPWGEYDSALFTVLSFLNTTKFPPSLDFLLMTLGPGLLLLAVFEKSDVPFADYLQVFGRVPVFFYIAVGYSSHLAAIALGYAQGYPVSQMLAPMWMFPPDYGYSLVVVYLVCLVILLMLYPLCHVYWQMKSGRFEPILKYI